MDFGINFDYHLYQCSYCSEMFYQSSELEMHVRTHTCKQSVPNQYDVTEQLRTCTGSYDNGLQPLAPNTFDSSYFNGNLGFNELEQVNFPTSNGTVDERNGFNNYTSNEITRPFDVPQENINFADPSNQWETNWLMQIEEELSLDQLFMDLQPPVEQYSFPTEPAFSTDHQSQYLQPQPWENSTKSSDYSTVDKPASHDLHDGFSANQNNQIMQKEIDEFDIPLYYSM